ncbi:hypothetical protein SAVIM338S_00926 [Streptomyces avidinii]
MVLRTSPRTRLLAALVVRANEVVSVSSLTEELRGWNLAEVNPNSLQVHIHRIRCDLRRWGGGATVVTPRPGYLLRVEPEGVDIRRFSRELRMAQQTVDSDPLRSGAAARRALAMWRGEPFEGLTLGLIGDLSRVRLRESRLLAVELAVRADIRNGLEQKVIPELFELVTRYPNHERFHEHLMLALYRAGRQVEALEVYRAVCNRLAADLGVKPSPMFTQRMVEILRHDASLRDL